MECGCVFGKHKQKSGADKARGYSLSSGLAILNSILYGNIAAGVNDEIYASPDLVTVTHSIFWEAGWAWVILTQTRSSPATGTTIWRKLTLY